VARLLEVAGPYGVTILHEQPSESKTIVEKFEQHASGSDYAVVLLTADDVGSVKQTGSDPPDLAPRGRQNVVLEMGFFIGRIDRRNVCVLYDDGVELPSDMNGVVYVLLDEHGAWKTTLLKELRNVGFDYDLNKLI
jgi:predicted nucleotide-binding protein